MTTLLNSSSGSSSDSPSDVVNPPPPAWNPSAIKADSPVRRRLGVAGMLIATAILYIWNLGASGYANEFYAAAVQAGTKSWKAFLFGSSDWGNSITVDKPPASLWPMELSGRIFGFNSWSMLIPEALMGVAAVGLLYLTVKRWFGTSAGFLAGGLLALTPVAVLMFRFNNPDALLTLLVVVAAYCITRAVESARARWLLLCGATLGFAFLTKSLQGFTVIPGFVAMYLVAAPTSLGRRLLHLLAAGAALLVSAGWWVAIVALWPAGSRPYIGGSTTNSALELAFGYNGLGRITGDTAGNGGGANFSGSTGLFRLFNSEMGTQISWLLPAALIGLVAVSALSRRAPRTDRSRAAMILWGGWLLVTGAVLSFASGTIHSYYTIELAPAIAALVAISAVTLWRLRTDLNARLTMALGVLVTGIWGYELLQRDASWHPWISYLLVAATLIAVAALAITVQRWRQAVIVGLAGGLIVLGGGSAAYALSTASTPHTGSTPSAGPAATGGFGGGFGGRGGAPAGGFSGGPGGNSGNGGDGGTPPSGGFPGAGGTAGGTTGGTGTAPTTGGIGSAGSAPTTGGTAAAPTGGGSDSSSTDAALIALLKAAGTKWSAATIGSQTAASLQLNSDTDVMPIGGFTGSDNSPTLAQFKELVAKGEIRYFIAGGGFGGGGGRGGSSGSSSITSWVESNFSSTTVGGTTVYDLTKAATS
ncbi:4-amino-4-deoxy-L-arabinose transferase [Frankineae bacterium MT45]|nr:4-amino-4-deoxy-L-arabinose transferase [Frankineae bacterium MT45]